MRVLEVKLCLGDSCIMSAGSGRSRVTSSSLRAGRVGHVAHCDALSGTGSVEWKFLHSLLLKSTLSSHRMSLYRPLVQPSN